MRPSRPVVAGILLLAVSCASGQPALFDEAPSSPVPVPDCATSEAERLRSPLLVYSAPDPDSAIVARLEAGRYIYRCVRSGDWLGIWFADDRVDCSTRPDDRKCPSGWINQDPDTESFG
ncbi:MAG TPA: hypothetical protein VED46_08035 [Alphaproteobacteria bacterium]|nr:hypothetical protein [Alphaproteobacteria bacterium]